MSKGNSAIKITKAVSPYRCGSSIGVRVRLTCKTSEKLSPKIFAYNSKTKKFNHVCNVIDLIECPEDTPSEGNWPFWYRKDYVDLLVPTVGMAYDFMKKVDEDVADLYAMMQQYNTLITEKCFIVGNPNVLPKDNLEDNPGNILPEEEEEGEDADNGST